MDSNLAAYAAYETEKRRQAEQQQQNQPNLIDALSKLALGAGAVAAGAYGLRRMLPAAAKQVAQAPAESAAVRRAAGAVPADVVRQQRGIELTRLARTERPRGVVQTNLSQLQDEIAAAEKVLQDPEMLSLVKQQQQQERSEALSFQSKAQAEYRNLLSQKADEVISAVRKEANTTQAAAQGDFARQYMAEQSYVEPSMVAQHRAGLPNNVDHAANAFNSSQDQEAARAAQAAVRDVIGTDLGAVNARAEQLEAEYQAVAQRTGATPPVDAAMTQAVQEATGEAVVDQAENSKGFLKSFMGKQREQIISELAEQGASVAPSRVEAELARRLGPESYEYGSEFTKAKQAMESGLEDPRYLQATSLAEMPTTRIVGGTEFSVNVKDVMADEPELAFRKPFISEETAIRSEQDLINQQNEIKDWLGNIRVEVSPKINALTKQQAALGEEHNMLMYTLNKQPDPNLHARFQMVGTQLKETQQELDFLNRRLQGATSAAEKQLNELSKWTPTTLIDWSGEGTVVRPKRALPDTMSFEAEGGELSNIELGTTMAQPGPGDLEIVPGGLLSGGRVRSVPNIGQQLSFDPATGQQVLMPLTDPESGEEIIQKLAGKRMGETTGVRGRGGVAGMETKASKGIYGIERGVYGTAAQTKEGAYTQEASQVPSLVQGEPTPRRSGGFFKYPQQREAKPEKYAQVPTTQSQEAFDVARQLRQLQQSGRPGEEQAFLDKIMKQRGISGAGGTFSPFT